MALTDEQEAALKQELETLNTEIAALKEQKTTDKKEVDEDAGKKLPEESPEKAKINADYAKSIQDHENRVRAIEERMGTKQEATEDDEWVPFIKF